jgi:CRP-like cAMP-binding protein
MFVSEPVPRQNRILAALSRVDYARIASDLETVALVAGSVLQEEGETTAHVYFPQTGILSLLAHLEDGDSIEISGVGNEGMVGVSVFLGVATAPAQVLAQVAGTSLRMTARRLRGETSRGGALHDRLGRYTHALLVSTAQTIACNRFHHLDARCARWLLATHDRVPGDEFVLTHEFLAMTLGVRRAGVTTAAGALQREGLISYAQGHVKILNRAGLEAASCECYRVVRATLDDVFHDAPGMVTSSAAVQRG